MPVSRNGVTAAATGDVALGGDLYVEENDIIDVDQLDGEPVDGTIYGRRNKQWVPVVGGGGAIGEAPADGKVYLRNGSTTSWQTSVTDGNQYALVDGVLTQVAFVPTADQSLDMAGFDVLDAGTVQADTVDASAAAPLVLGGANATRVDVTPDLNLGGSDVLDAGTVQADTLDAAAAATPLVLGGANASTVDVTTNLRLLGNSVLQVGDLSGVGNSLCVGGKFEIRTATDPTLGICTGAGSLPLILGDATTTQVEVAQPLVPEADVVLPSGSAITSDTGVDVAITPAAGQGTVLTHDTGSALTVQNSGGGAGQTSEIAIVTTASGPASTANTARLSFDADGVGASITAIGSSGDLVVSTVGNMKVDGLQTTGSVDYLTASSGVTNPMTANLDGGGFNVTNVNQLVLATSGDIGVQTTNTSDIGSSILKFKDGWFAGQVNTVNLGATGIVQGDSLQAVSTLSVGTGAANGVSSTLEPTTDKGGDLGTSSYAWNILQVEDARVEALTARVSTIELRDSIIPSLDATHNLGSSGFRMNDIYGDIVDTNTLRVQNNVATDLIPVLTNSYDLGSPALRWDNGYFNNLLLTAGASSISTSANNLGLDAAGGSVEFNATPIPRVDGGLNCGLGAFRWAEVFAVIGTINTSDKRRKENTAAVPLIDSEAIVDAFVPTRYTWKADSAVGDRGGKHYVSCLAQDLHAALVASGADPRSYESVVHVPEDEAVEDWGWSPTSLIPHLANVVKDQRARIADLEAAREDLASDVVLLNAALTAALDRIAALEALHA